jgi:hypothetical protein
MTNVSDKIVSLFLLIAGLSLQFANCAVVMTIRCLETFARLDLQSRHQQEIAVSILKKAINVSLSLSRLPIMQSKPLIIFTKLKEQF